MLAVVTKPFMNDVFKHLRPFSHHREEADNSAGPARPRRGLKARLGEPHRHFRPLTGARCQAQSVLQPLKLSSGSPRLLSCAIDSRGTKDWNESPRTLAKKLLNFDIIRMSRRPSRYGPRQLKATRPLKLGSGDRPRELALDTITVFCIISTSDATEGYTGVQRCMISSASATSIWTAKRQGDKVQAARHGTLSDDTDITEHRGQR